jgi:hypothetical protein
LKGTGLGRPISERPEVVPLVQKPWCDATGPR